MRCPSRRFLIQQATLNVLQADYDRAPCYGPNGMRKWADWRFYALGDTTWKGWAQWARLDEFVGLVRAEFRRLEATYAKTVI